MTDYRYAMPGGADRLPPHLTPRTPEQRRDAATRRREILGALGLVECPDCGRVIRRERLADCGGLFPHRTPKYREEGDE